MKSYTTLRNTYGKITLDASSDNLTFGDEIMNDEHRTICAMRDWPFLHRLRTATTIASTTFVEVAYDVEQIESVFVTVGTTRYNPRPAPSRAFWDQLHYSVQTSDTPEYWIFYNGQLGLWPRPASSSNTISMNAKIRVRDLNIADITSSTITTLANGGTALTVSAGLTVQMAGFYIRPTMSTTANTGDGNWYELSSVTNATTGTLVRGYAGVSIAAGTAACTIGQMPLTPEFAHDAPMYIAAGTYWYQNGNSEKGDKYNGIAERKLKILTTQYVSGSNDMVIDDGGDNEVDNPNLYVSL